jgi:hypothetical protein
MGARGIAAILLLSAWIPPAAALGGDDQDPRKAFREAFKPLRIPPAAVVEKDLTPLLPAGIVVESAPFQTLVTRLLEPYREQFAERERTMGPAGADQDGAGAVAGALKTLEKENEDLAARVAGVEAMYSEVYDAGYMESGEKQHRARKLAAVLVPFYRTLALRNAAVAARSPEALARAGDPPRIAWLVTAAARDASPAVRAAALGALGRIGGPECLEAVKKARAVDAVPSVRMAALSALFGSKVSEVKDALIAALGDPAWEIRSLAAAACARGGLVEAADALVKALEKEEGRLRKDLDDALHDLLGVRFYGDAALWRRWLEDNGAAVAGKAKALAVSGSPDRVLGPIEGWEVPGAGSGDGSGAAGDGRPKNPTSSFYGIDTTSRRVLFIVDISKSMEEPAVARPPTASGPKDAYAAPTGNSKIEVARWQLHRAVAALPRDAAFSILVFSESYKAWQEGMTEASPPAKARAHAFVDGLKPNGTTNIADSIDDAFDLAGAGPLATPAKGAKPGLAVDTVYLLTDGVPNRGRICDLPALLDAVLARNRSARFVFHVVGIGEVEGSEFLKSLARRTGGQYVGFK